MRTLVRFLFAAVLLPTALGAATPRQVYTAACASCHGDDGRGHPAAVTGLAMPLPDFSDCNFATREPDSDWGAIGHEGGPARGFHRMMPAFGGALTVEEVQLALDHIRTFCPDKAWPRGEMNLPRPLVTEKAFPEDEAVWSSTVVTEGSGSVANKLIYEKRFHARNQWEVILPFSFRERTTAFDDGSWSGGVGDIALAVKRVMMHSTRTGSIFSASAEVILPTGDEDEGFGKGTAIAEPFLAFGQLLPGDAFVQMQLGAELPFESGRDDEAFWRVAVGRSFNPVRFGRTWSPMLEILANRELVSGADIEWDAVPQVQVTLSQRQHIRANVGVRFPADDRDNDPQFMFYLLWDWFDGGLTDGW